MPHHALVESKSGDNDAVSTQYTSDDSSADEETGAGTTAKSKMEPERPTTVRRKGAVGGQTDLADTLNQRPLLRYNRKPSQAKTGLPPNSSRLRRSKIPEHRE